MQEGNTASLQITLSVLSLLRFKQNIDLGFYITIFSLKVFKGGVVKVFWRPLCFYLRKFKAPFWYLCKLILSDQVVKM